MPEPAVEDEVLPCQVRMWNAILLGQLRRLESNLVCLEETLHAPGTTGERAARTIERTIARVKEAARDFRQLGPVRRSAADYERLRGLGLWARAGKHTKAGPPRKRPRRRGAVGGSA